MNTNKSLKTGQIIFVMLLILLMSGIQSAHSQSYEIAYGPSFTLRDYGLPDIYIDDTDDEALNNFYGWITETPGLIGEHYFEFDISGQSTAASVYLSLGLDNVASEGVYGIAHDVSVAYYVGGGYTDASLFGTGTALTTVTLPVWGVNNYNINVTSIFNEYVNSGYDYLGFRLYDPVWTYSEPTVGDQAEFVDGMLQVTVVPEPISSLLFVAGATALGAGYYRKRCRLKNI